MCGHPAPSFVGVLALDPATHAGLPYWTRIANLPAGELQALAAALGAGGWTLGEILIAVVVVAACVGIVYIALSQFGVEIPPIILRIILIVVVAAVAIVAIRFLLSL